jgi:hypothetical protein
MQRIAADLHRANQGAAADVERGDQLQLVRTRGARSHQSAQAEDMDCSIELMNHGREVEGVTRPSFLKLPQKESTSMRDCSHPAIPLSLARHHRPSRGDPSKLPPLVTAVGPRDLANSQNVGFRHFLLRSALSGGGAGSGFRISETSRARARLFLLCRASS